MNINYPETIINKSKGTTPAEMYLDKLCNHTFLSLWSYPNLFTNQGKTSETGDGKELCDLLVIFDNEIIIFSDKDCKFKDIALGYLSEDRLKIAWKRWYKKSIEKSAAQIYKAEDWIKNYPDRIFLDKACKSKFPFDFIKNKKLKVHRVVVAHGIASICKKYIGDGSGSLIFNTEYVGEMLYEKPFHTGYINNYKKFVHVLDDTSLDIVMSTLDTVSDFFTYLNKKEKFIENNTMISTGEEELLANYLLNINKYGEHYFIKNHNKNELKLFAEGSWRYFIYLDKIQKQTEADKISYIWDDLVETFMNSLVKGTQYLTNTNNLNKQAVLFKLLSKPNRFERRSLGQRIDELIKTTRWKSRRTSILYNKNDLETAYFFLILPQYDNMEYEEYRKFRMTLLDNYLSYVKLEVPSVRYIVGLAMDNNFYSKDFICTDTNDWTANDLVEAKKIKKNLLKKGLLSKVTSYEKINCKYPIEKNKKNEMSGKDRNKMCPCGSGKKFKKCCIDKGIY